MSAAVTELLYRRHAPRVLRYCGRYLRRSAEAEDALQQTFLQAHRALRRGVEPVSEATWLLTIARNVCLTHLDAAQRRGRVEFALDPHVIAEEAGAADTYGGLSADVEAALARLPERQRRALFLREWHDLSYAEIADVLGTSEAAVETLLFRARESLAAELGGSRRRRVRDLAGLLGWLRSPFGVSGTQVVAGAVAAVVVAGGVGSSQTRRPALHRGGTPPIAVRPAPAPASSKRPVSSLQPARRAAVKRSSQAPATEPVASTAALAPAAVESAAPPPATAAQAVGQAAPGATHAPATATPPAATPPTDAVTPPADAVTPPADAVTAPLQPAVDSALQTVSGTVAGATQTVDASAQTVTDSAVQTLSSAAQPVADAAQAAVSTVTTAAPSLLPGH